MRKNTTCYTVGVWGHAPPPKFFNLGAVRFLLRPFLGQYDAFQRPNNRVLQKEYLPFLPIVSYSMVSAFRSVCFSVKSHTLYRWGLQNLPFAYKNEKLLEGRLAEQFCCKLQHDSYLCFGVLHVHSCMFIIAHKCTITIVLHAQAHNYGHPKYTWYYSVPHCVAAPCNHIQKERLLTWVVIVRSSSEIHTPIASPYAQMTLDDHHMEWSGNCNKRWIRKRLISYFHTLLGLYVHFKLQDH